MTYLLAAEKGVVIANDRNYTGLSHSGNESWNYTATTDLTDVIPMQKLNHVMVVGKEEVSIYDMTKMQSGAAGVENAEPAEADDTASDEKKTEGGAEQKSAEPVSDEANDSDTQEEKTAEDRQENE